MGEISFPVGSDGSAETARRLDTLRSYHVLDTDPEAAFDEIAALTAEICGAPVALISLVEETRQWFKAEHGLGVRETPIRQSVCANVMRENGPVVIRDTSVDPRSCTSDVEIHGAPMRFYAGVPLKTAGGIPLGTLCVLDVIPRSLSEEQIRAIDVLARQVMSQLELRKQLRRADLLRREVDHRVKNSLQSVAALARLEARQTRDDGVRDVLEVVSRRIETVAALNSELYRAHDSGDVRAEVYLESIAQLLQASAPPGVTLDVSIAPVRLRPGIAGPLGLIVNECVTNSFKHAFDEERGGSVIVTLAEAADGGYCLTCTDDGYGASGEAAPAEPGLGRLILASCADQMAGRLETLSLDAGYGIRLTFHP